MIDWRWLLIAIVIFVVGVLIGRLSKRSNRIDSTPAGMFIVNYDDPTKEFVTLKLNIDLPEIESSSYISFKVEIQGKEESDPKNSPGENL